MENRNTETQLQLREATSTKFADGIVSNITPSFSPTLECNPYIVKSPDILEGTNVTTSGTSTIITGRAGLRFVVTSATLSIIKDATCDIATGDICILATVNGLTRRLLTLPVITLTAQNQSISLDLARPLKCDTATAIEMSGTFTAGACVRAFSLIGYWEEVRD